MIDPKAVDPEDTETLADLVVAAVQAANENAQALQQEKLGPLAQGLGGGAASPACRSDGSSDRASDRTLTGP